MAHAAVRSSAAPRRTRRTSSSRSRTTSASRRGRARRGRATSTRSPTASARRYGVVAPFVVSQPPWLVGASAAGAPAFVPWAERALLFFPGHVPKLYINHVRYKLWRQVRNLDGVTAISGTLNCTVGAYAVCEGWRTGATPSSRPTARPFARRWPRTRTIAGGESVAGVEAEGEVRGGGGGQRVAALGAQVPVALAAARRIAGGTAPSTGRRSCPTWRAPPST